MKIQTGSNTKIPNSKRLGCVCAGILFVCFSAQAQVSVSAAPSAPASNVVTSYIPDSSSGYQWRNNDTGRRDLGQSFRVSQDTVMTAFSIAVAGNVQSGAYRAPFTVNIFESESQSAIGSVISTQAGRFLTSSDNPVNPGWLTFNLDAVKLTASKYYTFVLSWDNAGVPRQDHVFASNSGSGYPDGRRWESANGSSYSSSTANDLVFVVQGTIHNQ